MLRIVKKKRILYIDIARVLAMFWIVGYWHLIQYSGAGYVEKYTFPHEEYITMAMLAMFYFVSGYLSGKNKIETKGDIKSFYKRRFWRFYLLYVMSAFSLYFIGFIENVPLLLTTITATSSFILPQPNTLWFMSMLTILYVLTPLIKKNLLTGGGMLIFIIILHYVIPEGVDTRLFLYYPVYTGGIYLSKTGVIEHNKNVNVILAISLILSVVFFYGITLYEWLAYPFIILGLVFVLSLTKVLETPRIAPIINIIAYTSLCAYLFHRQIYSILTLICEKANIEHPLWVCIFILLPICIGVSYVIQAMYDMALKKVL